jgi:hypothetical protein
MSDPATRALDDAFIALVADWSGGGVGCDEAQFEAHALALFAYQIERNEPYRLYAATLGFEGNHLPATWREIPAVPASAFKDATLATFDVSQAELLFQTSGTTGERSGKHYVEHARLYDAALLAGFDRFMLPDRPKLRYLNLVPNPRWKPHSSLGYMMGHVSVLRGEGSSAPSPTISLSALLERPSPLWHCSTLSKHPRAHSSPPRARESWRRAVSKAARESSSAPNCTRVWKARSASRNRRLSPNME